MQHSIHKAKAGVFIVTHPSPLQHSSLSFTTTMNNDTLMIMFLLLPVLGTATLPDNPTDPVQSFQSPPAAASTIPAFPEQSDSSSGCPLDLPNDLFASIKPACSGKHSSGPLRRSTCCPVLAAWLYYAYSATALGKQQKAYSTTSYYYDLPLLPNDSETCMANLENGLRNKGIELMRVNQTCDVVYCECGIRLHPFTCSEAFSVNSVGELVGNYKVKRLEKDCVNNPCSKCLKTLHRLNKVDNTVNTSKAGERTSKMHNADCELMGLTWLLAKNRSAYIHTVTAVLRATMMTTDVNSIAQSCTLNSDRMPLAVDSSEISDSSSSNIFFHSSLGLFFSFTLYVFRLHSLII